ncbi:STAS domain-containing protein [Planktotalea sp.]|uniref:STAS domain-containing protein n=1 Tax=Planktotalea sp. TaxID=2029877 RepID=UPI0032997095
MEMTSDTSSGLQIIKVLDKRIDAAAAIQFKESIRSLTSDSDGPVVLDLAEVDFVDSSGLGAIVAAMKFLGKDRPLHLAALTPIVAKVFTLTRMEKVFKIFDTPSDAIDASEANRA